MHRSPATTTGRCASCLPSVKYQCQTRSRKAPSQQHTMDIYIKVGNINRAAGVTEGTPSNGYVGQGMRQPPAVKGLSLRHFAKQGSCFSGCAFQALASDGSCRIGPKKPVAASKRYGRTKTRNNSRYGKPLPPGKGAVRHHVPQLLCEEGMSWKFRNTERHEILPTDKETEQIPHENAATK